jgi:hypothetical protein
MSMGHLVIKYLEQLCRNIITPRLFFVGGNVATLVSAYLEIGYELIYTKPIDIVRIK